MDKHAPGGPVWWLALCLECQPLLPQPFAGDTAGRADRDNWASQHNAAARHLVLLARQDTATGDDLVRRMREVLTR